MAKEATEIAKKASYEHGVEDTKNRVAEEMAGVCKDYYTKTWIEALNNAGVLADSKLRKTESIFFPEHIWEGPTDLPPIALPFPPSEQVSSIQNLTFDAKVSTRAGKGKEVLPSAKDTHSEDALMIKDVVF